MLPHLHADETTWHVGEHLGKQPDRTVRGGTGQWLWTFTNPTTTLYAVDRRASETVGRILGAGFGGVPVSDCLASYDPVDCPKHKCIAHHQRAVNGARWRCRRTARGSNAGRRSSSR